MKLKYLVMGLMLALMGNSSASVVMFEMGDYVAVLYDYDDWEIYEGTSSDHWPLVAGFEPITDRSAYESNFYKLKLTEVYGTGNTARISPSTWIAICDYYVNSGVKLFKSEPLGDVEVGKINKINTTLYKGTESVFGETYSEYAAPFYVEFKLNNVTACEIYNPSTSQTSFEIFLDNIDILPKENLPLSRIFSPLPELELQ